ncbi:MAG TPA: AAA family ATPase, partial [Dissulfurispiraceae bacterium]|nr:AAA family ATPase [Dissulfurispiraceae bacterium]
SHGWQELLEEIEALAKAKYGGNTFRAWGEGTPKHREFVDALLRFPGHVIATMRSKTEYIIEENGKGKMAPRKVGMAPEQGKGIEYEFDILFELNHNHYASITKDRTGKYQDKEIEKPGIEFGKELVAWLNEGKDAPAPAAPAAKPAANPEGKAEPKAEAKPADENSELVALITAHLKEYYAARNENIPFADFAAMMKKDCFKTDKPKLVSKMKMAELAQFNKYIFDGLAGLKKAEGAAEAKGEEIV